MAVMFLVHKYNNAIQSVIDQAVINYNSLTLAFYYSPFALVVKLH